MLSLVAKLMTNKEKQYLALEEMFNNGELEEFIDDNGNTHYKNTKTGVFYDSEGSVENITSFTELMLDSEEEIFTSD